MEISKQQAQDSLNQIENVAVQTRRKIAASSAGPILIIWGTIWFVAYLGTYLSYFFEWKEYHLQMGNRISASFVIASLVWPVLIVIGVAASWFIATRKAPTRNVHNKRLGLTWLILFVYSNVWLVLLAPWNEYQISAFAASLPMFAYIIMGLWMDRFLLWLGVVVTLLIIAGFFLFHFHPLFWLWMAVLGGGTLAGTGFYIQIRWR